MLGNRIVVFSAAFTVFPTVISLSEVVCPRSCNVSCVQCLQKTVYGANVVIFEGILAFANKELLKVRPLKVSLSRGWSYCAPLCVCVLERGDKSPPFPREAVVHLITL